MPIHHVGGAGNILDHGGQNQDQFSDDSSDAEEQILNFLLEHFALTESDAKTTLALIINSGEDARALALGIEMGDDHTIGQIALYIT